MFLLFLISAVSAATLNGDIVSPRDPNEKRYWEQRKTTKVILDNGEKFAYPDANGHFKFFGVEDGTHIVEVYDAMYHFNPVLVEVSGSIITAQDGVPTALRQERVPYPLRFTAERRIHYFETREGFSIASIFLNPMVLIAVVMIGLTFCMPKMKLDPEQMKEMKEMQKTMNTGWLGSLMQPPQGLS
ncbi:unnamed protein product [Blepharisma stoltei]|uniref:ER membrane protein complex subunit 7 beta-sandwich domain-containing protein n=1 Tax=Blepharisma stoltei TaxID=1481888 RepID=A0AAU9J9E4_9CILI|nr:unnamed protein product [Blepharisma stoltei]